MTALPYAHRGLHGEGRLENSRGAFEAAIARGHGIELDVQESSDGRAMVFHDRILDRLTRETGPVAARTAAELEQVRLAGIDETIPTLNGILALIAGRVPLLIEVKAPQRRVARLCGSVRDALRHYRGIVGVMSFNPEVSRWFAANAPELLRGLVVTEEGKKGRRGGAERFLALLRARPQFLAYDIRDFPSVFAARARARGMPVLTWTCRTERDLGTAAAYADQIIYERPR